MATTKLFEKTLGTAVTFEGKGLHTGERAVMTCRPAAPGAGLRFFRMDGGGRREALLEDAAGGAGRRSTVGKGDAAIDTVEHVLSALAGLEIANAEVEVSGPEVPAMDGSAKAFVEKFLKAGIVPQARERDAFEVTEPIFYSAGNAAISAFPHDGFRVTYTLDYDHPALRAQVVSFEVTDRTYADQIAPARTFCTEEEAAALQKAGFGRGADTANTLVMSAAGPVKSKLAWPDECARHKVLDLIGDLGLLGFRIVGHIVAVRSGHGQNRAFVEQMRKKKGSHERTAR